MHLVMQAVKLELLLAAVIFATGAKAQTAQTSPAAAYPNRPIRIVVPFPADGTSDVLTRLIGAKVTPNWGQPVIADNRTEANGNIAAEFVSRSAADRYTSMLSRPRRLYYMPQPLQTVL